MGEGEGGGGQKGLFSPSPQSPPVEGGEGNQLKSNQIFIIALQGIVKTYYRPPLSQVCAKTSLEGKGEGGGNWNALRTRNDSFLRFRM